MRLLIPVFVLAAVLAAVPAIALEGGTILSTEPGTGYTCVYVDLPQDLGVSRLNRTSETIIELDKGDSPWADTTYNKVVMDTGVVNRNPVCFLYSGREEGEFSFYNINLRSSDLDASNSIFGGLCISGYEDADTGIEAASGTDVCELLSENADIIDISFGEDVTQAGPEEVVTKTLYVTSYATLRIRLSIATNLQNDFSEAVVSTSPSRPTSIRPFKVKAPEAEGEYEMTVLAQVEGCGIQACRKQKNSIISVKEGAKTGFSASVIPKNINLKSPGEVSLRVVISNYGRPADFVISAASEPSMRIEPESRTVAVGQNEEKTSAFTAFPGNDSLYRLDFKITSPDAESLITSYISVGEVLTDGLRYAADTERTLTTDAREELRKARLAYEAEYNRTSYGEDIEAYETFVETIDGLKQTSGGEGNVTKPPAKPTEGGLDWMLLSIPLIIIAAVVLVLVAIKKAKSGERDDSPFGGYAGSAEGERE